MGRSIRLHFNKPAFVAMVKEKLCFLGDVDEEGRTGRRKEERKGVIHCSVNSGFIETIVT